MTPKDIHQRRWDHRDEIFHFGEMDISGSGCCLSNWSIYRGVILADFWMASSIGHRSAFFLFWFFDELISVLGFWM